MGRAVLAEFNEEQYVDYLEERLLIPYTKYMVTNTLRLKKEIKTIKETHITSDDEEIERGIFCIEASIMRNEQTTGVFSVGMPKYHLIDETKG